MKSKQLLFCYFAEIISLYFFYFSAFLPVHSVMVQRVSGDRLLIDIVFSTLTFIVGDFESLSACIGYISSIRSKIFHFLNREVKEFERQSTVSYQHHP